MNKREILKIFGVMLSTLIVLLMILSYLYRETLQLYFTENIQAYGLIIMFVVSGLLETIPQLVAPHFLLLNSALLGFPDFTSFVVVTSGAVVGAIIGLDVGRHFGYNLACEIYTKEKVDKIKDLLNSHGRWFVTLAALSPLPYLPVIFGSLGMKRRQFYIHGLIPRIISFIVVYIFVILRI
jgi:membrane protein YqaA with SNARE-associated domain